MSNHAMKLTSPPEAYRRRRQQFAAHLTRPVVVFAGHAPARTYPANTYDFRAGSSYLYLGGPPLEHAAILIEPGTDGDAGCTLFRPAFGPEDAVWLGTLPDDGDLAAASGITRLASLEALPAAVQGRDVGAIVPPFRETIDQARAWKLDALTADEQRALVDLRLVKDEYELAAMRHAAAVSVEAQRAALAATQPDAREAVAAAAFHAVLIAHQCRPSYSPIITVRGEVLHGHGHANRMHAGDLLLADAAAEEPGGYASDITRTWPVNGRWTQTQREVYEIVLRALNEAVAACVPGARYLTVHDFAAKIICTGLVEMGLLRGNAEELAARRAHTLFFTHGLGHLIGLDVHDMEDFGDVAGYAPQRTRRTAFGDKFLRLDRDLQPGYTLTVEPGIYFTPALWASDLVTPFADVVNRPAIDALLRDGFGGIRIEHTICVRDTVPEVLTETLPTAPDEVAACVGT